MPTETTNTNGRVNVGRIDHVVLIYRNRENRDAAKQQFSALLEIDDWDDLGDLYGRVDVSVSWTAGIELIFPTREGTAFAEHLEARGEGFYSLVFGVADLDDAMSRAAGNGGRAVPFPASPDGVLRRFEVAREAALGTVGAIDLILGEFKPHGVQP